MLINFVTKNELGEAPKGKDVPEGTYAFQITGIDQKTWEAYTFLEVTLKITTGKFANRLIWLSYRMEGPDAKLVQIGRSQFAQLTDALAIEVVRDSSQLLGKRIGADLVYGTSKKTGKKYPGLRNIESLTISESTETPDALASAAEVFGADIETMETAETPW